MVGLRTKIYDVVRFSYLRRGIRTPFEGQSSTKAFLSDLTDGTFPTDSAAEPAGGQMKIEIIELPYQVTRIKGFGFGAPDTGFDGLSEM
ncbi:hypothetical protein RUM44_008284 [Polyplax serrata]|uniref:Uncharacterized protein n=1 Tax=Polyplax serrata TaxID=468196 RepID=A0ABR1BC06_POLSC